MSDLLKIMNDCMWELSNAKDLPEDGTYMFRYNDGSPELHLEAFKVVKETPKGKWVESPYHSKNRFILNKSNKRFAHETREEALKSFKHRKFSQIRILKTQLERAQTSYLIAGGDLEGLTISPFKRSHDAWYF